MDIALSTSSLDENSSFRKYADFLLWSKKLIFLIVLPVLVTGLQFYYRSDIEPYIWFIYYPVVFLTAYQCGFNFALLSTIYCLALISIFFKTPYFSLEALFTKPSYADFFFFGTCIFVSFTISKLLQNTSKLNKAFNDVKHQNQTIMQLNGELEKERKITLAALDQECLGTWSYHFASKAFVWTSCPLFLKTLLTAKQHLSIPDLISVIHPDDHLLVSSFLSEAIAGSSPEESVEFRIVVADSSTKFIRTSVIYLNDDVGSPIDFVCLLFDITDSKQIDELKTQFFSNISHKIRTPMNAILGLVHFLRDSSLDVDQEDKVHKITLASRNLLSVINNMIDFSRLKSANFTLLQTSFSISSVIDQVASLITDSANTKGLRITTNFTNVPTWVIGDQPRLVQLLLNYANNAIKFTNQGAIEIRVSVISQDLDRLLFKFEVIDTGIGINPSELNNIFSPYFQFPHKNPIDQGASGLGLAINKLIAQAMGGEVGCSSELGKGSTFWFTAWLGEGKSLSTSESIPAESLLTRLHAGTSVLLVEDEPINREVALLLLNKAGLRIDWAANGEAALKRANEKSYDLIIIDIQMPVMDGIQATTLIRQLPNRKSTPIIAFTANVYDDYRSKCLACGMNDFIEKPVKPNQFYETILRWLPNKLDSFHTLDQDQQHLSNDAEFNRIFMELDQCIEIDFNPVFHRFSKNKSYYVNSLHRFLENHTNDPINIFTHATNSNFVDANLLLSSIKANALTLGLLEIYKATLSIEFDMKAGNIIAQSKIDNLISLFVKVANVVHNKSLKSQARPNPTSNFLHLMTQLRAMIINGEYQARLFFSQSNYFFLNLVDTDTYLKLESYLNNFDYDSALLIVDHLLSSSAAPTS